MEHPGNQEGGNVIQDDIGAAGTQASPTVWGREPPGTGGAPDSSRTVSPNAPNLALGTAADGAVPQGGKENIHHRLGVPQLSQGPGDKMIPTLPGVRLPTALKPLGKLEFIPSGSGLQNLLPPSLGSQPSIPT